MHDKFRSIQAFKRFEQRSAQRDDTQGDPVGESGSSDRNALRVLATVKAHKGALPLERIAAELAISHKAVEEAVLRLERDQLVTVHAEADVLLVSAD